MDDMSDMPDMPNMPDINTTMNSAMNMNMDMSHMHMTFFWSRNAIFLFNNWPGSDTAMYFLALIAVFGFASVTELLSHCRLIRPSWNRTVIELAKTGMHTVRMGLYYLTMLAVMSFNGGVFIVAVFGHAFAFFVYGSSFFKREKEYGIMAVGNYSSSSG